MNQKLWDENKSISTTNAKGSSMGNMQHNYSIQLKIINVDQKYLEDAFFQYKLEAREMRLSGCASQKILNFINECQEQLEIRVVKSSTYFFLKRNIQEIIKFVQTGKILEWLNENQFSEYFVVALHFEVSEFFLKGMQNDGLGREYSKYLKNMMQRSNEIVKCIFKEFYQYLEGIRKNDLRFIEWIISNQEQYFTIENIVKILGQRKAIHTFIMDLLEVRIKNGKITADDIKKVLKYFQEDDEDGKASSWEVPKSIIPWHKLPSSLLKNYCKGFTEEEYKQILEMRGMFLDQQKKSMNSFKSTLIEKKDEVQKLLLHKATLQLNSLITKLKKQLRPKNEDRFKHFNSYDDSNKPSQYSQHYDNNEQYPTQSNINPNTNNNQPSSSTNNNTNKIKIQTNKNKSNNNTSNNLSHQQHNSHTTTTTKNNSHNSDNNKLSNQQNNPATNYDQLNKSNPSINRSGNYDQSSQLNKKNYNNNGYYDNNGNHNNYNKNSQNQNHNNHNNSNHSEKQQQHPHNHHHQSSQSYKNNTNNNHNHKNRVQDEYKYSFSKNNSVNNNDNNNKQYDQNNISNNNHNNSSPSSSQKKDKSNKHKQSQQSQKGNIKSYSNHFALLSVDQEQKDYDQKFPQLQKQQQQAYVYDDHHNRYQMDVTDNNKNYEQSRKPYVDQGYEQDQQSRYNYYYGSQKKQQNKNQRRIQKIDNFNNNKSYEDRNQERQSNYPKQQKRYIEKEQFERRKKQQENNKQKKYNQNQNQYEEIIDNGEQKNKMEEEWHSVEPKYKKKYRNTEQKQSLQKESRQKQIMRSKDRESEGRSHISSSNNTSMIKKKQSQFPKVPKHQIYSCQQTAGCELECGDWVCAACMLNHYCIITQDYNLSLNYQNIRSKKVSCFVCSKGLLTESDCKKVNNLLGFSNHYI